MRSVGAPQLLQGPPDRALALPADTHLHAAYRAHVAASRYGGVRLGWGDLIVPADITRRLQLIAQMIGDTQLVRQLGITPLSGLLLSGPPGTGKTTVARVLASETEAAFLAVNAADIFSKWLGESEQHVRDLFARARQRVSAIIFMGRRRAMLDLFTRKMRLDTSVHLERLAAMTDGANGALLKGLCAISGRNALVRALDARGIAPAATAAPPTVNQEDFERALKELSSASPQRRIGFGPQDGIRRMMPP